MSRTVLNTHFIQAANASQSSQSIYLNTLKVALDKIRSDKKVRTEFSQNTKKIINQLHIGKLMPQGQFTHKGKFSRTIQNINILRANNFPI